MRVLEARRSQFKVGLEFEEALIGGAAIDAAGSPLPPRDARGVQSVDADAARRRRRPEVGRDPRSEGRPEQGLLANPQGARPVREPAARHASCRELAAASPLKPEKLRGVDILVDARADRRHLLRQAQTHARPRRSTRASTPRARSSASCRVAAQLAHGPAQQGHLGRQGQRARDFAALARGRDARVAATSSPTSSSSTCWSTRPRCTCMRRPADFDVIVTENMFGDILTDEASMLAGSLGPAAVRVARRRRTAASTSRSTARRPTSPARASPTRAARS